MVSADRKQINRSECTDDIKIPVVFKINTSSLSMVVIKKTVHFLFIGCANTLKQLVILECVQLRQFYCLWLFVSRHGNIFFWGGGGVELFTPIKIFELAIIKRNFNSKLYSCQTNILAVGIPTEEN